MPIHDRKGAIEVILGKLGPKKADDAEAPAEEADADGLEVAAQEFLDATAAKDAKAAAVAFRSMFDLCRSEPYDETPTEEPDDT
jgi:hypothetical protein